MNKAKLYSALAMREQEFDIKEIKTIVKVLNLSRDQMNDIFFEEIVS